MTQLNQFTEKTNPNANDWLLIQDGNTNVTQKIQKQNLVLAQNEGTNLKIIQLSDTESLNTPGGNATTQIWTARTINTINHDDTGNVSLSNNVFTLPSGNYWINAGFQFYKTGQTQLRLRNITDNTVALLGRNAYLSIASTIIIDAFLSGFFSISSAKSFSVEYWIYTTSQGSLTLGQNNGIGNEIYGTVDILKVA